MRQEGGMGVTGRGGTESEEGENRLVAARGRIRVGGTVQTRLVAVALGGYFSGGIKGCVALLAASGRSLGCN